MSQNVHQIKDYLQQITRENSKSLTNSLFTLHIILLYL